MPRRRDRGPHGQTKTLESQQEEVDDHGVAAFSDQQRCDDESFESVASDGVEDEGLAKPEVSVKPVDE